MRSYTRHLKLHRVGNDIIYEERAILLRRKLEDRRCALTATTTGPTDSISWETIWDIGVKLTGACARSGKQGRQINLGMLYSESKGPNLY